MIDWKVTPTGIVRATGYWTLTLHQTTKIDFLLNINYSGPDKLMWPSPFATVFFVTPFRSAFADDAAYLAVITTMANRIFDAIEPLKEEISALNKGGENDSTV